jgi:endonuclease G
MATDFKPITGVPLARSNPALEHFQERFEEKRDLLERQMTRIALGQMAEGETIKRREMYCERARERAQQRPVGGLAIYPEASFGLNDFLSVDFFKLGYLASRSIGRIMVGGGMTQGSGFLVSPDILMTNHHVIRDEAEAAEASVEFQTASHLGQNSDDFSCDLDPGRFSYFNAELDFALVAVAASPGTSAELARLGWHPMIGKQGKILIGHPITVIQFPDGREKSAVLHNSHLLDLDAVVTERRKPFFWYRSDTDHGSSGSPVFNREWDVIGVHHAAVTSNEGASLLNADARSDPNSKSYVANEGIRTSVIVDDLKHAISGGGIRTAAMADIARDLLAKWDGSEIENAGLSAAWAAETGLAVEKESARPGPRVAVQRENGGLPANITLNITING